MAITLHTPEEGAELIRDVDRLGIPLGPGQPAGLLHALGKRERFDELVVFGALLVDLYELFTRPGVRLLSGFYGPAERFLIDSGADISFVPSDFRRFTPILERIAPRVMATAVSAPLTATRQFAVTWGIPDDFGGMTRALLARSAAFARRGAPVDVLTFDGLSYTRIIQPLPVSVPLDEFVAWVAKNGGSLGPLELAHDEPGVELQLHTFDRPPESLRMSEPPAPDPIHRKPTLKLSAVRVPKEAYRPDGPPPPASPTQKLPQVKSPAEPGAPRDDVDEGWE